MCRACRILKCTEFFFDDLARAPPSDWYSKLGPNVDLREVAHNPYTNGFSCADCAALLREVGLMECRFELNQELLTTRETHGGV